MKREDKIIEVLARIIVVMIIIFCIWLNYELKIESGDGMQIALLVAGYNCGLA